MVEVAQRSASLGDLKGIWSLMQQIAGDVPFDLKSEAEQEKVLSELMACCTSGLSPVAVTKDDGIVGALLVRRDDFEWGIRNGEVLNVAYAAIAPAHRDQGVLRTLMAEVQERKVPVFVSVKAGDKLGLADELKNLGFVHECTADNGWGDLYKWRAPAH